MNWKNYRLFSGVEGIQDFRELVDIISVLASMNRCQQILPFFHIQVA